MCNEKVCGGLNFKEIIMWNEAAIAKHFWALAQKQDRLRIKWLHAYYIKQANIWTINAPRRFMRGDSPKVNLRRITCNSRANPRTIFIT